MGKRKKSSRKPAPARKQKESLDREFTCLYCHHNESVTVRIERKEGVAFLVCRVCDQRYQSSVNHLTEAVDIYSAWIDAADAAQKEEYVPRRPVASSSKSRALPAPALEDSGDEEQILDTSDFA